MLFRIEFDNVCLLKHLLRFNLTQPFLSKNMNISPTALTLSPLQNKEDKEEKVEINKNIKKYTIE